MYDVSQRFLDAIGGSHRAVVRVQVLPTGGNPGDAGYVYRPQFGASPTGGTELPVLDGDIKLASTADVQGTCEFTISGDYWDLLQPYGAELFVERGVDFGDGTREYVPCGYYGIEEISQSSAPAGPIQVSGADRTARMKRNRVIYPVEFPPGTTHKTIFDRLVNGVTPAGGALLNYPMFLFGVVPIAFTGYDPQFAKIGTSLTCEDDAHAFLSKIADTKGCVLRFDRHGGLVVALRNVPTGAPPVYTVAPGPAGNLIGASRKVTRDGVYNYIVARGSDPANPTGYRLAHNDDPLSQLFWASAFGTVARYYASPLILSNDDADSAAESVLARYKGLPSSMSLLTVPNPALDPLDVVQAVIGTTRANHLIDQVDIPLVGSSPVQIVTRTLNEVIISDDDTGGGGGFPNPADPGAGGGGGGTGTSIQAAQLILARLDAGQAIFEDWTWTGSPAVVAQWNDSLQTQFVQDTGPYVFPDDVDSGQVSAWLRQYLGAGGGGGGGTTPDPYPLNFNTTIANRIPTSTWAFPSGVTPDSTEVHEFLTDPANTLKATVPYPGTSRTAASALAGGHDYQYAARFIIGGVAGPFSDRIRVNGTDWTTTNEGGGGTGGSTGGGTGTGGGGGTTTTQRTAGPGGIPKPAGAVTGLGSSGSQLNITSGGSSSSPRVIDGESRTVGRINITADWVVVQNYKIDAGNQYGCFIEADNVTFQNNDIKGLTPTGDGDLNAMTVFGSGIKILYNTMVDFVDGSPGDSHTDGIQTWVSSSHSRASNNWEIIGNVMTGPSNTGRSSSIASIHQCIMVEGQGHGGNSGGSGGQQSNWLICDNTFSASWNQDIKFDCTGSGIVLARNKFTGSSDRVIEDDTGGGLKFYSSNQVTGNYGQVGISTTSGDGPPNPYATVTSGGGGTGGGGGGSGTTMAGILRLGAGGGLTKVNLGVDFLPDDGGKHVDYTLAQITNNLSIPGYADISTGKVRLTSYVGAATTPNSTHSRTEYRELGSDGVAKASWDSTSGTHYVWVRGAVVKKAPGRPHVVLAQIHDASDDVATIRMEGTTVVSTYGDSGRPGTLATGVTDGSIHQWMIKTVRSGSNTVIQFFWDDMSTPKATQSYSGGSGNYFKYGNYHQSTTSDDDQGASFIVDLYDSEVWHTGYPAPTPRN